MTTSPNPLRPVLAPARSIGDAWLKMGWDGCRATGPDGSVFELSGECVGVPSASAPLRGRLRGWELEIFGGDGPAERLPIDAELLSALADRTTELADTTGALIDANDQLLAMYGLAESSTGASADRNVIADLTDEACRLTRGAAVLVSLENGLETSSGPDDVVAVLRDARDGSRDRVVRADADHDFDVAARRLKGNTGGEILIAAAPGQRFTTPDLQRIDAVTYFMSGLVSLEMMHRAALASAVIERDAATAAQLAQMVLPDATPDILGLDIAARCDPARLAAGDFYTWIDTPDGLVFAVGDVSGKGLAAAMVMTMVTRATVRLALAMPGADPTEIFGVLAAELTDDLTEASVFVTMIVGSYRAGDDVIRLANAGHSPVLVRTGDHTAPFPASAPPLGVLADLVPDTVEIPFNHGDTIMIGTDGLAEQEDDSGEQIGYDHLVDMVDTHAAGGADHLVATLFAAVEAFAGEHDQDDDRTALVLHRSEHTEPPGESSMTSHLSVTPDLMSIREIGPWLRECVTGHIADADVEAFAMRAELAMQEVAANIVNHGHVGIDPERHPPIGLDATIADGALRIEITDHGTEYEPEAQPEPALDAPQVHGYGLMIVRQLTRRFDYVRRGNTNHTTLEFELPDSSST